MKPMTRLQAAIGAVLVGYIGGIVGRALDLNTFDFWTLIVALGLLWFVMNGWDA